MIFPTASTFRLFKVGRSTAALPIGGAVGALASALAVFIGILLRGGAA